MRVEAVAQRGQIACGEVVLTTSVIELRDGRMHSKRSAAGSASRVVMLMLHFIAGAGSPLHQICGRTHYYFALTNQNKSLTNTIEYYTVRPALRSKTAALAALQ